MIDDLDLRNLPLQGGPFTWSCGLNNQSMFRLDPFLVTEDWESHFSGVVQYPLLRLVSNHFPILLDGGGVRRGPTPFHFENMWLKEEGFKYLLKSWWQGFNFNSSYSFVLTKKLKALKTNLKLWNKDVFGKIVVNKLLALEKVSFWDEQEKSRELTLEEVDARKEAREDYKKWVLMEEVSWRQKSREVWLKEGEKNIDYFHRMTNAHKRRNWLAKIKINGSWFSKENEIKEGVARAF